MCVPARTCKLALAEASKVWPGRSTASDGICGDAAHQARKSDHNTGDAFDLTRDLAVGLDTWTLGDLLRERCAAGLERRATYIISNGRIASAAKGWVWRPYTGVNAHKKHLHVSIRTDARDNDAPWWAFLSDPKPTPTAEEAPDMTPAEHDQLQRIENRTANLESAHNTVMAGIASLADAIKALSAGDHASVGAIADKVREELSAALSVDPRP